MIPYPNYFSGITPYSVYTMADASGDLYRVFSSIELRSDWPGYEGLSRYRFCTAIQKKVWSESWENTEWEMPEIIAESLVYATGYVEPVWYTITATCSPEGIIYLLYRRRVTRSGQTVDAIFIRERDPATGMWSAELELITYGDANAIYQNISPYTYDSTTYVLYAFKSGLYLIPSGDYSDPLLGGASFYGPVILHRDLTGTWQPEITPDRDINPDIQGYYNNCYNLVETHNGSLILTGHFYQSPMWDGAFVYQERDSNGAWSPRTLIEGDHIQPDYYFSPVTLPLNQFFDKIQYKGFITACSGMNYWGSDPAVVLTAVASSDLTYQFPDTITAEPLGVSSTLNPRIELNWGGDDLGFTLDGLNLDTSEDVVYRRIEATNSGSDVNGCRITAACTIGTVLLAIEYPGDTMSDAVGRGMSETIFSPPVASAGSFFFWLKWTAPSPKVYGENVVTITFEIS